MSKKKAMFFNSKGGGGFTAEYEAILSAGAAYTLPTAEQQSVQNQIIVDMKADGLWDTTDAMFYFKGDGDSDFKKINWKNPTGDKAVDTGATPLTYATDGLLGNDINYLDLKWNPTDDSAINYTQNNFSIAIDIVTAQTTDTSLLEGNTAGAARSIAIQGAGTFQYYHSTGNGARSIDDFSGTGFKVIDFLTNVAYIYTNGTLTETSATLTTDSFVGKDFGLLKIGSSGRGTAKIGSIIFGGSLDSNATNHTNLYNAINGL